MNARFVQSHGPATAAVLPPAPFPPQTSPPAVPYGNEAEGAPVATELVDAHGVLGSVIRECRREIEAKRLHVSLRLLGRQPRFRADPERVRRVYRNLLRSAIASTPTGGRVTIRSSCPTDCALRIEVEEKSAWKRTHNAE